MSEYAGYTSWDDLQKKEDNPISRNEKLVPDELGITLFTLCLKNHHFDTVLQYIDLLPSDTYVAKTHRQISRTFGQVFRKDIKARNVLLPELAKTKNGRDYFFETFVDIDYINQYYNKAIVNNYIPAIGSLNEIKNRTDFVFAKSIEFIAYVTSNNHKRAISSSYELFQKINVQSHWQEFSHPYPYARLISVFLISEYLKDKLTSSKVMFSINKIENVLNHNDNPLFVLAQLIMALNYCECYQEAIGVYEKYKGSIDSSNSTFDYNYASIINCIKNCKENLNIMFQEEILNSVYVFEQRVNSINKKTPVF